MGSLKKARCLTRVSTTLGATATGANDQRPNPFDPALNGVENHAALVDNIVSQDFLRRLPEMAEFEMNLFDGYWPYLLINHFSRATLAGILAVIFCIAYYHYDRLVWFENGIWTYMAMPYIEIFTLFFAITLYKYATEEKENEKSKAHFHITCQLR